MQAIGIFFRNRIDRWQFRNRGAEVGEVYLDRRRVYILPTGAGLAFGVLLILLFIGSINYSLNLGFVLTFLIAACAVVDMHLTFRNLAHLYLRGGRAQPVFAGEEAQFELHLTNRRKHDRYAVWIGFLDEDQPDLPQAVDIRAESTTVVTLGARPPVRGWFQAPRVRLFTRFPLGLLRAWSYWRPDSRVLVYPKPEEFAPPLPMQGVGKPDGQGQAGHDDFAGIRAYQSGDSLKRLAWRQIARLDAQQGAPLITKHFEGGAASELVIDYAQLPHNLDVEAKLSRMTRWVIEAEARGLPYAFRLGADDFPTAIGASHCDACLRALALYDGS